MPPAPPAPSLPPSPPSLPDAGQHAIGPVGSGTASATVAAHSARATRAAVARDRSTGAGVAAGGSGALAGGVGVAAVATVSGRTGAARPTDTAGDGDVAGTLRIAACPTRAAANRPCRADRGTAVTSRATSASAGLVFQDWFLMSSYEPAAGGDPFLTAVAALPKEQRWAVMERVNHRNSCHFFTTCRPERPAETNRVDFTTDRWLDAVPLFRYRCGLDGEKIFRPGWSTALSPEQLALVRLVDGRRTIREIIAAGAQSTTATGRSPANLERFAHALVESLVNRDFLVLALRR